MPKSNHAAAAQRRGRLGELLYSDPDPFDSSEQFTRFHHDDLAGLSLEQLDDERILARLRRALSGQPSSWLAERIARLEAEAARRRSRTANVAR